MCLICHLWPHPTQDCGLFKVLTTLRPQCFSIPMEIAPVKVKLKTDLPHFWVAHWQVCDFRELFKNSFIMPSMTMSNNPFVCFSEFFLSNLMRSTANLSNTSLLTCLFYLTCYRQARHNDNTLTYYARRQFNLSNKRHNKLRFSNGCKHSAFETLLRIPLKI